MSKAADLREIPELPDEIIQAGLNGELVLLCGGRRIHVVRATILGRLGT